MPELDRERDVGNFHRHSSYCYKIHGHIRGVIGLRQGRHRESHTTAENLHRTLLEAKVDCLQMSFPDHTAAMVDTRRDQPPANLTCT